MRRTKRPIVSLLALLTAGVFFTALLSPIPAYADPTDVSSTLAGAIDVSSGTPFALQSFELDGKRYWPTLAHSDAEFTHVGDLGEPVVITDMPRTAWLLNRYGPMIQSEGSLVEINGEESFPGSDNALLSAELSALLNTISCDTLSGALNIGSPCHASWGPFNRFNNPDLGWADLRFGAPAGRTQSQAAEKISELAHYFPHEISGDFREPDLLSHELIPGSSGNASTAKFRPRMTQGEDDMLKTSGTSMFYIESESAWSNHGKCVEVAYCDYPHYDPENGVMPWSTFRGIDDSTITVTIDGPARFTGIPENDMTMGDIPPSILSEEGPFLGAELGEISANGKQWTVNSNGWTDGALMSKYHMSHFAVDYEIEEDVIGDITYTVEMTSPTETLLYYPDAEVVTYGDRKESSEVRTFTIEELEVADDVFYTTNKGGQASQEDQSLSSNDPYLNTAWIPDVWAYRGHSGLDDVDNLAGGYSNEGWNVFDDSGVIYVKTKEGVWLHNYSNTKFFPHDGFVGTAYAEYRVRDRDGTSFGIGRVEFVVEAAEPEDDLVTLESDLFIEVDVLENDAYSGETPAILIEEDRVPKPENLGLSPCYGICMDEYGENPDSWRYAHLMSFFPEWYIEIMETGEFPPDFDYGLLDELNATIAALDMDLIFYGDFDDNFSADSQTTSQGVWSVENGKVVFTPAVGFYGTASINYVVIDETGNRGKPATITVDVQGAKDFSIETVGYYDEDRTQMIDKDGPTLVGSTVYYEHIVSNNGSLSLTMSILNSLRNGSLCTDSRPTLISSQSFKCESQSTVVRQ